MAGRQGKREKQLSKDTAVALHHTCYGLVEITKHLLLQENYEYVCLGEFSTDRLEKAFGKFRQGSGGAYFITAQQVIEKLRIKQAKLQISLNSDIQRSETSKHQCKNCEYVPDGAASTVFVSLPELEDNVSDEMKGNLVHIAGYVARKLILEDVDEYDDTYYYYEKYGGYLTSLDRGGLKIPTDSVCQWAIFCSLMFDVIKNNVCRKSLASAFLQISDTYNFDIKENQCIILANIFLNNFCKASTPLIRKEFQQKVIKLS